MTTSAEQRQIRGLFLPNPCFCQGCKTQVYQMYEDCVRCGRETCFYCRKLRFDNKEERYIKGCKSCILNKK
jgi:hypothetical protein